jgi:gamma-glutamyltranspeptidase/glutathione hydrolase
MGREIALSAARDYFYHGPIAKRIVEYSSQTPILDDTGKSHTSFLTMDDFEAYHAKVEEPISLEYRGLTVHKCNTWCQGAVLLQQLSLLQGYDLKSMKHNSVEYLHLLIECAKLAFADREHFYGDPDFVEVPLDRLLSEEYARERRTLIESGKASLELRSGDGISKLLPRGTNQDNPHDNDTTHIEAVDIHGNMISATPSGGWISSSPVIPGLGFPLGTRAQMFSLDPMHPNGLQPHKRPRTTLTPSLVTKNGHPYMTFGTPGGDMQDQWTLQFFLNFVEFGMNLQEALDAPTYHSVHFPASFYPREAYPGRVLVEGRIPETIRNGLAGKGHEVMVPGDWEHGRCLAIHYDEKNKVISAGASPRRETGYAIAW